MALDHAKNQCFTLFSWTVLLLTGLLIAASCGQAEKWETVQLSEGIERRDLLLIDLYSPFERDTLLDQPEDVYGEPTDSGSRGEGSDYVDWTEYVGAIGRIRIFKEYYFHESGVEFAKWLEVFPGALYLEDVIHKRFLAGSGIYENGWKLSFEAADHSWFLTINLDGRAVTSIADVTDPQWDLSD